MKILIKGGRVLDPATGRDELADVLVEDGLIAQIGANLADDGVDQVLEATGCWVTPGLIDMHVHLREPGLEAKETIATGTRAAARGGFTSVACMPNTNPVADNASVLQFIKFKAATEGVVNVYPIGAISKGSKGEELAEIADLKNAGAVALSDDGRPVANSEVMRHAMEYANMYQLPIISHCEDQHLAGDGVMNEGYYSTILGLRGIPAAAEEVMVARDIILAELTKCPVHIAHISTAGSVRQIRAAKARGVRVTAEVTPHHFTLSEAAVAGYDTNTKVNPPLGTEVDIAALKAGLADGTIDVIATDHAPHAPEEKDVEYNYAPFGMVGLETALGLVFRELIEPGILSPLKALAKLTANPATILNLPGGSLAQGKPADLVIIDPQLEEEVTTEGLASKGKNTPFLGWTLKGLARTTLVDGKVVMLDRQLQVQEY